MRSTAILAIGLSLLLGNGSVRAQDKPLLVFDSGGHTGRVRAVAFTPDGKQVVSVSEDKTVRIWDVDGRTCLRVIRPPIGPGIEGALYGGGLSPDGKTIAVAGYGYAGGYVPIYLIDFVTGEIRGVLKGHGQTLNCLAFSPDGKLLASAGHDPAARVWNLMTSECIAVLSGHKAPIYGITFSPDSKHVATAANDGTARVWDVAGQREIVNLAGHTSNPQCIAWSPDGTTIATGSLDESVLLFNPQGERIATYEKVGHQVFGMQFTSDSKKLLFCRGAGKTSKDLSLMSTADGTMLWDFVTANDTCYAVAINPRRPMAAVSCISGEVFLVNLRNGKLLARLGGGSKAVQGIGWSADGKSIAWGNAYKKLNEQPLERAFNLLTEKLTEQADNTFVLARTMLGGARLERGSATHVKVTAADASTVNLNLPLAGDGLQAFTWLDPGRAVVGSNFALLLFDTRNGQVLRTFKGHVGSVHGVAVSPDGRYFATAGNDHTVRIWRPDQPGPLLSYFFVGNEWIAWTGEGYYASSAGGESMMGWLISRGKDRTGLYCPSAQVRKKLYRPVLLRLLLEHGDLQTALDELERATRREEPATNIVKVLPPSVTIVAPAQNPMKTDEELVEVKAEAQSVGEHPVVSLRVLLDGRPYPGKDGTTTIAPPQTGTVRASWKLKLPPGEHQIVVQAESPVSKGLSVPLVVTRAVRSFKAIPDKAKEAPRPALYVLSIGISDYKGKLKLDYAAKDAEVFAQVLANESKPLFKDIQTKPLLDKAASREGMIDGLKWLRREATQDDICILFFAGHGERDTDSGSYYLMPHDAEPQKVALTGFSGNDLKAFLAMLPARRVLVILDTCHAGAFAAGDKKRSLPEDVIRDLASTDVGVVVMASSMAGEASLESVEHKQGYFTLAMVEGLKGKAANEQGVVYISDLDAYVTQRVKTLTHGQQHPVINRPIRSIPLAAPKLVKKAG